MTNRIGLLAALRTVLALTLPMIVAAPAIAAPPHDLPAHDGVAAAERLFDEGSYGLAQQAYETLAAEGTLDADLARWVTMRTADAALRSLSRTQQRDQSVFDGPTKALQAIIDETPVEQRDATWATAHVALGDFWWLGNRRNAHTAWQHYGPALDHWAASTEIEIARDAWLAIVRNAVLPNWSQEPYLWQTPTSTLRDAVSVAGAEEQGVFSYALARKLTGEAQTHRQRRQLVDAFQAVIERGAAEPWYDDALFHYGAWLETAGSVVQHPGGAWSPRPDFLKAVAVYRTLLESAGASRFRDDAQRRIEAITKTAVGVGVGQTYMPGSEIALFLNWRNVDRVQVEIQPIDVTTMPVDRALASVKTTGAPVLEWSVDTNDAGDHMPGQRQVRAPEKLAPGAYVVVATGGRTVARDLLLVTDLAIITKSTADDMLVYCCDAISGAPVADATITARMPQDRRGRSRPDRVKTAKTNTDGLARIERIDGTNWGRTLVYATSGTRVALAGGGSWYRTPGEQWRVYAFADRPAYRPGETVQFKLIARQGRERLTPGGQAIKYRITDPDGSTVADERGRLNDFGSAWGELELTSQMKLGEYQLQVWAGEDRIGNATLFRLEEYKLPEFVVRVKPAMDGDVPRVLRAGEEALIEISAEYTFGGPVAGAQVEAVVNSSPFWMRNPIPRPFPWCYETPQDWRWRQQNVIHRVTLETDAEGRVMLRVPTEASADSDVELRIEARVTDASRREIVGQGIVRVTRQGYYVFLKPRSHVVRPGAKTEIDVRAIDANDNARSVTGTAVVERQTWREHWVDPLGFEHPSPPPLARDRVGWICRHREYEFEKIHEATLTTDDEGMAVIAFTPKTDGIYRVTWRSPDGDGDGEDEILRDWIEAHTTIWVADPDTTRIAGRTENGIEIIVDKDTFRAGDTAPVMLTADANGRWVLFGVEDDSIRDLRIIHMTGNAKVVQLPIGIEHQPNVWLTVTSVRDGAGASDTVEVVVPPIDEYLDVSVALDRTAYEPGETGIVTVKTLDQDGRPVSAEVGLALVDEAVMSIQQPYAMDPRAFFFTGRNQHQVRTDSSVNRPYVRLVKNPDGEGLVDERWLATGADPNEPGSGGSGGGFGGGGGGVDRFFAADKEGLASASGAPPAPSAAAAPMRMSMKRARGMAAGEDASGSSFEAPEESAPAPEDLGSVTVRSDFRSTLFWGPDMVTDADGTASVEVTFADSLTTWRSTARAATTGVQFGTAKATARTRKPLIARLQAPRFFVVGDETVLSGVINNNTEKDLTVTVGLEAEGLTLRGVMQDGRVRPGGVTTVAVPAGGEARVDFSTLVEVRGAANVTLSARAGEFDDGMTRTYPVEPHGIEQLVAHATVLRGDEVTINVELPRDRRDTTLEVQVAPSLAVTMLDALPYLVDYPYGCTEQTMSRFLPAVITASTLRDLDIDPEDAMSRVFGGIEQAHVAKTHPKPGAGLEALAEVFRTGVARLEKTQNGDGGWGWWPESRSDRFMTAYVVWGLALAQQAGAKVAPDALARAQQWLDAQIIEDERAPNRQAWLLHAATVAASITERRDGQAAHERALANLIEKSDALSIYGLALTALAAHEMGETATAKRLVRNLASAVKRDEAPGDSIVMRGGARGGSAVATAHWGESSGWWRWFDGGIETTAFALRAMLAIDPGNALIAPTVSWLIGNRRAAQWSNTRDTAIVVLALNDYLKTSGELNKAVAWEISVNGTVVSRKAIERGGGITAPSTITVDTAHLQHGMNAITIRRTDGTGPLYLAARARYFSLEEPVPPAGNQIFARRDYNRLAPVKTLLRGYRNERSALPDEGYLDSGDRVEVVITLEAKNDLEYVMIEDLKPAGLEAVGVKSGARIVAKRLTSASAQKVLGLAPGELAPPVEFTGQRLYAYQELRDRKVALFLDRLPEGIWELRYTLRAEIPGRYHAMPTIAQAMYVPEIRGNSAEKRMTVGE